MTRIVKSDDDELEEAAEEFLLFHDEAPEEETFVQISFDTTPLLDSDSKFFTDHPLSGNPWEKIQNKGPSQTPFSGKI